jgi:hypothetical protein
MNSFPVQLGMEAAVRMQWRSHGITIARVHAKECPKLGYNMLRHLIGLGGN